jgi:dihydroorotate dehydrogenase electron transfer subunit
MATVTYQLKAKILFNEKIKGNYWRCIFDCMPIAKFAAPGQFLEIEVSRKSQQPLLRRPFSIHKLRSQKPEVRSQIEIIYEVVGEGSRILSQRRPGEYLDIIGPLGNGFSCRTPNPSRLSFGSGRDPAFAGEPGTPILVAGGMGVAPLTFLAEKLKEIPKPKSQIPNLVLIGAKSKSQILCEKEFKKFGCQVKIATDDGSRGYKGKVTELLKQILRKNAITQERYNAIYACGPRPMLREIAGISKAQKIPAQISLEEHMACGIGACLGCVVNTRDGYQRVCKDGPVFPAEKIIWG